MESYDLDENDNSTSQLFDIDLTEADFINEINTLSSTTATGPIGFPAIPRRCQLNAIERKSQSNQSNAIKRDRIIAIRLSTAIESQSNGRFLGNIGLRLIGILRSIAFD